MSEKETNDSNSSNLYFYLKAKKANMKRLNKMNATVVLIHGLPVISGKYVLCQKNKSANTANTKNSQNTKNETRDVVSQAPVIQSSHNGTVQI